METYCLTVEIKSSCLTPFHNDTMFGQLCWGIKYGYGETALLKFLEEYNDEPPLILSSGFPAGYMPMPVLKPVLSQAGAGLDKITKHKEIKKIKWIEKELLHKTISISSFLQQVLKVPMEVEEITRQRNSIDRLSQTTLEGGLYSVLEHWHDMRFGKFIEIYLKTKIDKEKLQDWFVCAFSNGFGADASIGKGRVEVVKIEKISLPGAGNRAMALGNFIPRKEDNIYEILGVPKVKFGKLGGDFVHQMNPFKKPVLMYPSGTTFTTNEDHKSYIGRMVNNINQDARIKHFAYTPIIYFNEEVKEDRYE